MPVLRSLLRETLDWPHMSACTEPPHPQSEVGKGMIDSADIVYSLDFGPE